MALANDASDALLGIHAAQKIRAGDHKTHGEDEAGGRHQREGNQRDGASHQREIEPARRENEEGEPCPCIERDDQQESAQRRCASRMRAHRGLNGNAGNKEEKNQNEK